MSDDADPQPKRPKIRASKRVPRGYETINSIVLTEPRIEAIRRELQQILKLGQFEKDGKPIRIDGFRLRNPAHWADYPTSLSDIFWHLSSVCNFSCEFCYEKGNPSSFPIQNQPRMATADEIDTRLAYYNPLHGTGIFGVRTSINEPFANPKAIEYLRRMREKSPNELISFVTNGSYLNRETVAALAEMPPIFFNLSLYSTDPDIRRTVLRDRKGGVAVQACELLAEFKVPYMANLVMWPSIPFDDMEKTILHASDNGAALIRVCLGGYSRHLEGNFKRFKVDDYWPQVVSAVENFRSNVATPILIEPNSYVTEGTDAIIDGVIDGSPAALAGIRRGDIVLKVDGREILTKVQLGAALRRGAAQSRFRPPGVASITAHVSGRTRSEVILDILRDNSHLRVRLERYATETMAQYPYGKIASFDDFMYGLVITDSLRYSSLRDARTIIDRRDSRYTVILTSHLMRPIVEKMAERSEVFKGIEVQLRVPTNNYFGGTINVGDLLTVGDFVKAIRQHVVETRRSPDLVLIPASPFATSPWGRDLTGTPWTEIERISQIPVELIPCNPLVF